MTHPMAEPAPGTSGPGAVVLDIGAGTGALVLDAPPSMASCEIEISRNGCANVPRTHSCVRPRRTGPNVRYAAVYPALPAGEYTIWRDRLIPVATATVSGGQVTRVHWPA